MAFSVLHILHIKLHRLTQKSGISQRMRMTEDRILIWHKEKSQICFCVVVLRVELRLGEHSNGNLDDACASSYMYLDKMW